MDKPAETRAALEVLAERGDLEMDEESIVLTPNGLEALYWLAIVAATTVQGHQRGARLIRTRAESLAKALEEVIGE